MSKLLIDRDTVSLMSEPFQLTSQVTISAYHLDEDDSVSFQIVSLTGPTKAPCQCPPGQVLFSAVSDMMPLTCCGGGIVINREQPWVIIDAPHGAWLRAVLHADTPNAQSVWLSETNTQNVTERMRGCSCD